MKIKDRRKLRNIIKVFGVFSLSLCVLFSSIQFSFAQSEAPSGLTPVEDLIPSDAALGWIENCLEQDPDSQIVVWQHYNQWTDISVFYIYWCSADLSFYFDITNQNMACNSRTGMTGIAVGTDHPETIANLSAQYPGNNSFYIDGVQYWYFNGLNSNNSHFYYFYDSADFKDNGGDCSANLDISTYQPPEFLFSAHLTEDEQFIEVDVDFNIFEYPSLVTVWGYDEYGPTPFTWGFDEYVQIESNGDLYTFHLPLQHLYSYYFGNEFTINSISCLGWDDSHEEFLSVNWVLDASPPPTDYEPPDSNYYYSTFINENYNYSSENGSVISFGNVDICLYSDNTLDRVFWDKQQTLLTPYKYSYCMLPVLTGLGTFYYDLLSELELEFDIVLVNCPDNLFDAMYGQGAASDFRDLTSVNGMINFFFTHFRYYDLIPYSYFDNLPDANYTAYDCGCLYTDSFFFKSLAYLMGDNSDKLLELESRLLGEDGAIQTLLTGMKSIYDLEYAYSTDMLAYMRSVNFLVNQIVVNDYFAKFLSELETHSGLLQSIYEKLEQIGNALTDVGDEDFDNNLTQPWLAFYRYFKSILTSALPKLPDFLSTASEIIDGGSDQVGLGFELDDGYEQNLPLLNPSVSPTPIPIPTLWGGG